MTRPARHQCALVGDPRRPRVWCTCGYTSPPRNAASADDYLARHKASHRSGAVLQEEEAR